MKFNYSGLKINTNLRDGQIPFSYPVTSLPAIGKNHFCLEWDMDKRGRSGDLINANRELAFQNKEKEKRAAELIIANKELAFQNREKEARAAELLIANKELAVQNKEKEKRAAELIVAYKELKKADDYLKEYIHGLEEMMFITSHKVRQPVANILGLSSILSDFPYSPRSLKKIVGYLKTSALSLDTFTKELTIFISDLEQKGKENNLSSD